MYVMLLHAGQWVQLGVQMGQVRPLPESFGLILHCGREQFKRELGCPFRKSSRHFKAAFALPNNPVSFPLA